MLKLQPTEPEWLGEIASNDEADPRPFLLPGVRVRFQPIGRKAVRAAREAVAAALGIDERDLIGAADALAEELIRRGIDQWEGVGDRAGEPVLPTAENIALFLADIARFEACDRVYVRPWSQRDMEGNASAGSPNGTSAEATPANATANSPADQTATDDAGQTPTPERAAPAHTSRTSRRRSKAKQSGK